MASLTEENESCFAALEQFFSHCGLPKALYSEQLGNFTATLEELQLRRAFYDQIFKDALQAYYVNLNVKWHTLAPYEASFTVIWRFVGFSSQVNKKPSREDQGKIRLPPEEPTTLVSQIEFNLHSCPLTKPSNDGNDVPVVAFAHFQNGSQFLRLPGKK